MYKAHRYSYEAFGYATIGSNTVYYHTIISITSDGFQHAVGHR